MNMPHANAPTRCAIAIPSLATQRIASSRREEDDGPMTVEQAANARREVEYLARRNGLKEPLLQIWTVRS